MTTEPTSTPLPSRLRLLAPNTAIVAAAVVAILAWGCGSDEPEQPRELPFFDFPLEVETTDRAGHPVPGVPVLLDDQLVGFTDADGLFEARLNEQPTKTVRLSVDEPEGYRLTDDVTSTEAELQVAESLDGEYRGIPVTLRTELESTLYEYLVWVDLDCDDDLDDQYCQGVPVELDGEPRAYTDARGHTHFTFESRPAQSHQVALPITVDDDDDAPTIEPADPVFEFETGIDAAIFHISEQFTDPDAAAAPAPRPRRRGQPRQPDPPQQEEEPEDTGGPIQLF